MKKFIPFLLVLFFTNCKTQKNNLSEVKKDVVPQVTLTCEMTGCSEDAPLFLYQFDGYTFIKKQTSTPDSNKVYTFKVSMSENDFYFLGANPRQTKPIILGKEKSLTLQGNCANIRKSEFVNSPLNTDYEMAITKIRGFQGVANGLNRQLPRANATKKNELIQQLKENDKNQLALLQEMQAKHPFVGKIVATKTYRSFPNNGGKYNNELEYYLTEVFAHLDLKDPELNHMPAIFETFQGYTNTLMAIKMDKPTMQKTLDNILNQMNPDSKAYRYGLGAIVQTLKTKNHPAYVDYGNLFLEKYGNENLTYLTDLKKNIESAKNFLIGAVAPDFTQNTPEGKPMKLSDLRGKVVLVDFWASWCGPCRRENPNVVKLYNKYKDQGFEVLGISLDKTKDKWLKAIEKDGLTWAHVSDLRGWSNVVAKQYSVSSIPHTILLDKEGRILARNVRGGNLEAKLAEIFK